MRRPDSLVSPSNTCDICNYQFVGTDKAVCIVRIPDGGYDTVCLEDWHSILASAAAYIREHGNTAQVDSQAVLQAVQDILDAEQAQG